MHGALEHCVRPMLRRVDQHFSYQWRGLLLNPYSVFRSLRYKFLGVRWYPCKGLMIGFSFWKVALTESLAGVSGFRNALFADGHGSQCVYFQLYKHWCKTILFRPVMWI